ncbi:MAG: sigma-70 family RNA polymerase sigma factor [Novosphingobium sp.]|jgi:RNA polymerase sigma factor for flagellar operon FliA|nr:sigma-70 family RNA polymerase sigma factor [Novosphingobium sp.]
MLPQALAGVQPQVSGDDEDRLWRALVRDRSAGVREKLFSLHARFARNVGRRVRRERNYGDIDPADVDQAAYAGLIHAIDRFDPDRGVSFRGFAAARISGTVIETISKMSEMREQISWRHKVRSERIGSLHGQDIEALSTGQALETLVEIAVGLAVGFMLEGTGLYREEGAAAAPNAYESAVWRDMADTLRVCLDRLPERERSILSRHYFDGMTFSQIAGLSGLGKGRISQLHRSALDRLRRNMRQQGHFQFER